MVMVMEHPSPQSVGLQFVRQYYTMLNQAPEHLHRFYSNNSSFVHGGIERPGKPSTNPVYGQPEIHKRIMQLNFRDCHAKILLVDSQATLGDGVVVQVTGELSNNRGPMRRFMQTFVLALQSPKKYYVHNDILRYQDEVFPDEDDNDIQEGSVENEGEDEPVAPIEAPVNHQDIALSHFYNARPITNGSTPRHEVPVQPTPVLEPVPEPALNAHMTTIPPPISTVAPGVVVSTPIAVHQQAEPVPAVVEAEPLEASSDTDKPEYTSQDEDEYHEKSSSKTPESAEDRLSEPAADEPKTYATMLTKNPGGGSFASSPPNAVTGSGTTNSVAQKNFHNTANTSPIRPEVKAADNNFISQQSSRPPRSNKGPVGNYQQRDRIQRSSEDSNDTDRRRSIVHYPDNQQLFIGNLPYDVDETALRNLFSEFGTVVDMRINNKFNMMKPGNLGGRNFGFIVFDDPSTVMNILSQKQTHYLGDLRLNVEEKKAKIRMGGDVRPQMGRGGGNMGRIGSMMRGGNRGGGGNMGMNRGEGRGGGGRGGGGGYNNMNNRR